MFSLVFSIINFGVSQIFHIIERSLTSKGLRITAVDSIGNGQDIAEIFENLWDPKWNGRDNETELSKRLD